MTSSPYLQAIQSVVGSTPGEKYKTLNHIARRIIVASNGQGDTIQVQSSPELPEILIPLVKLEIARIIRQPDEIVEALKSDDNIVFNRALRVKWFFDGSIETVTNADYFRDRILGWISVKNRWQLIKTLSVHLAVNNKYCIAEKFYSTLLDMYGTKQSDPLLSACSDSFIWNAIIAFQLVLSARTVKRLYLKHPDVFVKYLKLNEPNNEPYHRHSHKIPMKNFDHFLPRLLKNHVDIFINIIRAHHPNFKLSRKSTEIFLKKRMDTLIDNPSDFVRLMNLKAITSKLTEKQFKLFFRNLFPINTEKEYPYIPFMKMHNEYLQYYPSEKKVPLILTTFKEIYKKTFIECDDLLKPEVLCLLSPEDRVYVMRKRLEEGAHLPMQFWNPESSWRCYLPISESIQLLKEPISKTTDTRDRKGLLKQMIYTCKVNNDLDALLKVLEYIATEHKNEGGYILLKVIARLMHDFQLLNLTHEHWKRLDEIMENMKDQLTFVQGIARNLLESEIHFNLIQGLSITEPIKILSEVMKLDWDGYNWNLLTDHPEYERKCLEEFIKLAPAIYPAEWYMKTLVHSLLYSINRFNGRNSKAKRKLQPLTIENNWLLTHFPKFVNSDEGEGFLSNLKKFDQGLYDSWVKYNKYDKIINLRSDNEFNEWKKDPHKIANHWEKYLEECKLEINHKYAQRFIKICRWHQTLPITLAEACVKAVIENNDHRALFVLALLLEGSEFERFIKRFLPTTWAVDSKAENAERSSSIIQSIPEAQLIVNPPMSLNITSQFCNINTIHMTADRLTELSRRTSVDKFIPFATTLMNQPVSVSKHFIRNFSTAATIKECHSVYRKIWRNEKLRTIRALVFDKIFNLFVSTPYDDTWRMLTEFIDNLTVDDENSMNSMGCLDKIPNKYIPDYVHKLFITMRKLVNIADSVDPKTIWTHIAKLLRMPGNVAALFPEELHHEILKTYFTDLSLPPYVTSAAQYYLINAYIDPALDKLESRLNFYSNMLIDILKNQWDIPDPHKPNVYPANHMVDSSMIEVLNHAKNHDTRLKFVDATLKALLSVLNPLQAPMIYSYYVFVSLHCQPNMSRKDYAINIKETIPSLITTFSVGFFEVLGQLLSKCAKLLWPADDEYDDSQHEVIPDIIQNLLELDNEQTTMLAITILSEGNEIRDDERYTNILQTFRQHKNPAAIASAAMRINRRVLEDTS